MASIIDSLRELVTPAILSRAVGETGESESAVAKGFSAVIPAIAAATADRSDDHEFMRGLADLATSAASGSAADTTAASSWLSSLFGYRYAGVIDSIGRFAGIRGSSAASLLTIGAPLVLGYLGRMMHTESLSATGVAERLRSLRPQLESALPGGFDLPWLGRTTAPTGARDEARRRVVAPERRASLGLPLMLLLGVLGLSGLIWWASRPHAEPPRASVEIAPSPVGTTGTVVLPRIPSTIRSDSIEFASGSSALTPKSRAIVDAVAAILRADPNATVTLTGHSDNVGALTANMSLSRARAAAVAKTLTDDGVASDRMHIDQVGSQQPVADNSTESGRAKNRCVMLEVAK